MRRTNFVWRIPAIVASLVTGAIASPAGGQVSDKLPAISGRYFNAGGSATLTVKGSFQIDQDIPINTKASFGDGEVTWIQFGVSGAEEPNVLVTFHPHEVGIGVSRGKRVATAGSENCTGKVEVTATLVSGHYTCRGITSYDPAVRALGKVDIEIRFTAKS